MYSHIKLGAINTTTGKYERVSSASKNNKYACPICKKDVIFAQGYINKSHFKHACNSYCSHYNGGETALHYNGKRLLKEMLENNTIDIQHECSKCKKHELFNIPNNIINNVVIEYGFIYEDRQLRADVALINQTSNQIVIFEVLNTHKTNENDRPEPWFEISAIEINELDINNNRCVLNCVRKKFCDECKKQKVIEYNIQQEIYRMTCEERMERDRIACEKQMELDRITQEKNINKKNRDIHFKIYKVILFELKDKLVRLAREKQAEIDRIEREKQNEIDRINVERVRIARAEEIERDKMAYEEKIERDRIKKHRVETKLKTIIQLENISISNKCGQCNNIVITGNIKKSSKNTIYFDYCKYVGRLENIKIITSIHKIYTFGNKSIKQLLTYNSIITEKICNTCITNNNNKINKEKERRNELTELDKIRIDKQVIISRMINNKPTIVKNNNKQLQVSKYVKKPQVNDQIPTNKNNINRFF